MPLCKIRAHYGQLSEFERGRIVGMKEAGWANWRIVRHMGRGDVVIRRSWQEWVGSGRFKRHDGSDGLTATTDRKDRLVVRSAVTEPDSGLSTIRWATHTQVSPMTIHRWLLCPYNHRRRVWRRLGQRVDLVFTTARHTGPHSGDMVWVAISFDGWTPLAGIRGNIQHSSTWTTFSENCFATVLFKVPLPYFSAR
ncbi:HTH_Tnp_Tc3_2 domain-containing protein [Trichonephila clavipes]|nr:HTH_Tnp_Tc3_2 domain-containing protein [Trichonephila clavipes]